MFLKNLALVLSLATTNIFGSVVMIQNNRSYTPTQVVFLEPLSPKEITTKYYWDHQDFYSL